MNKQEYQEKLHCIKTDNIALKLSEGIILRNQYIASIESENANLYEKLTHMYDTYVAANHEFGLAWEYANKIIGLKSENEQLKQDNLDLMKQVEIIGKALDITCELINETTGSCPLDTYDVCVYDDETCSTLTSDNIKSCWKEYFLKKAGE